MKNCWQKNAKPICRDRLTGEVEPPSQPPQDLQCDLGPGRPRQANKNSSRRLLSLALAACLVAGLASGQDKPPRLEVAPAGPGVLQLSWPNPSVGYVLQSSLRLDPAQWRDVNVPAAVVKEQKIVTLSMLSQTLFYRLRPGCIDFADFQPVRLPNPLVQGETTFTVHDAEGKPLDTATIYNIGTYTGLDVGFLLTVDLATPCLQVEARLLAVTGLPVRVLAFDAKGNLVGAATTTGVAGAPETVTVDGAGEEITQVVMEAPQDETLLLNFCCRFAVEATGDYYNPYGVTVDPANMINEVDVDKDGQPAAFRQLRLPSESIYRVSFPIERKDDVSELPPPQKISPVLSEWLATRDPREVVEILVTFQEDLRLPLLPDLGFAEDREQRQTRRQAAIENLRKAREVSQEGLLAGLRRVADAQVFEPMESFWIVNAVRLRAELGAVRRMAQFEPAAYLQPVEGGEPPPADGNNNNDVEDARGLIVSDPYFNLGLTQPWIGLLDTGIRSTHMVFNSPGHVAWLRDCVNGGANCNNSSNPGYDPSDFAWNHGTSSAAIIAGNNRLGAAWRGVTEVRLDSWQIYRSSGLDSPAAVRAVQAAVAAFDKVLVGEIQANESETGAIATAADNAYNVGAIFVAANGNSGPNASTVRSPGIAHKVIGVGGFMTDGGAQYNNQGRGPATDGRYKPDIQAPTWSETASATSDNAMQVFTGTSGATPYGAAVAMLARNWLNRFGGFDNGQTYAFMILYGQRPWPYDNTEGAGRLQMAVNGHAWWGKLVVLNGATIDIPISVGSGRQNFDAALWWPESASQSHNDIDLHLIDPFGTERARGYSGVSVFERARAAGSLAAGTWKVRVRGYSVPTLAQVVYWAAHIQN